LIRLRSKTGADGYLTKRFAFDGLIARVRALARRGRNFDAKPTRPNVGDFSFDRKPLRFRRGERAIDMTSRELEILELLTSSSGKLSSRERIQASVRGAATASWRRRRGSGFTKRFPRVRFALAPLPP